MSQSAKTETAKTPIRLTLVVEGAIEDLSDGRCISTESRAKAQFDPYLQTWSRRIKN